MIERKSDYFYEYISDDDDEWEEEYSSQKRTSDKVNTWETSPHQESFGGIPFVQNPPELLDDSKLAFYDPFKGEKDIEVIIISYWGDEETYYETSRSELLKPELDSEEKIVKAIFRLPDNYKFNCFFHYSLEKVLDDILKHNKENNNNTLKKKL